MSDYDRNELIRRALASEPPRIDASPDVVRRALGALTQAIDEITAAGGDCTCSAFGSLLAAQGLLTGDHGFGPES